MYFVQMEEKKIGALFVLKGPILQLKCVNFENRLCCAHGKLTFGSFVSEARYYATNQIILPERTHFPLDAVIILLANFRYFLAAIVRFEHKRNFDAIGDFNFFLQIYHHWILYSRHFHSFLAISIVSPTREISLEATYPIFAIQFVL